MVVRRHLEDDKFSQEKVERILVSNPRTLGLTHVYFKRNSRYSAVRMKRAVA
jgi:hypothetical protein